MDEITKAMRGMAWERAKGELMSLGHADYAPQNSSGNEPFLEWQDKCDKRRKLIASFIKSMEYDELW